VIDKLYNLVPEGVLNVTIFLLITLFFHFSRKTAILADKLRKKPDFCAVKYDIMINWQSRNGIFLSGLGQIFDSGAKSDAC
jgi:hypothetical protein